MARFIPGILLCFRLVAGLIILMLGIIHHPWFIPCSVVLMSLGLLSDIFDGIIARKLNISTLALRRLDSFIDQLFWMCIAVAVFIYYPIFFQEHKSALALLFASELMTYIVSFAKFRREVATHAIASKFWTLIMFATLLQLLVTGNAPFLFPLCVYTGLATRLEIIMILLLIRQWTSDVPSVYHAIQLRKGREIKRNKMFNG